MKDINGQTISAGQFLLYKVTEAGVAYWTIRKVEAADDGAGTITLIGPNSNPARLADMQRSTIHHTTEAVPNRFLLVLEPGPDRLIKREQQASPWYDPT